MIFEVHARVTRAKKCRDGFYLLVNGQRVRFASRRAAIDGLRGVLDLNRFQIVTVREFADRTSSKIKLRMPKP